MAALERFIHDRDTGAHVPLLVLCGLAHVQFETIHPFLDGNGRVGRLLVPLLLCERQVLAEPVLYLSLYLLKHRANTGPANHLVNGGIDAAEDLRSRRPTARSALPR